MWKHQQHNGKSDNTNATRSKQKLGMDVDWNQLLPAVGCELLSVSHWLTVACLRCYGTGARNNRNQNIHQIHFNRRWEDLSPMLKWAILIVILGIDCTKNENYFFWLISTILLYVSGLWEDCARTCIYSEERATETWKKCLVRVDWEVISILRSSIKRLHHFSRNSGFGILDPGRVKLQQVSLMVIYEKKKTFFFFWDWKLNYYFILIILWLYLQDLRFLLLNMGLTIRRK